TMSSSPHNDNRAKPTVLDEWARNLSALVAKGQLRGALHRETEVEQAVLALQARRSVLFVGPSGGGKTSVVGALAQALGRAGGQLHGLSTSSLMTDTKWLGEWQTKVQRLADDIRRRDAVLYVSDVWNLATAGTTVHDHANVLEALKPHIESGQ